jgi:lipopolysaccharide transport system ATP-binding protein
MGDPIIRVENLGKKYLLDHQQQERYTALRDVLSDRAKALFRPTQNSKLKTHHSKEEFWALKDVSFEINQGDRVGIIGRNGAGKSTLLKILSRITEPTTGRIRIKGRVASLLEVGTGFHPELTGRENIFLNGAILGMSREEIKRKFDEIVAFAEVEKFLDTPVKRYSSGMYVRLAFAVAAHLEPEVLVVDEVLAVGDAQFQKKCLGKMKDVGKEGRTVLFVSHNMSAIQVLCSRAIHLDKGEVVSAGHVEGQIKSYLENFREQVDLTAKNSVKLSQNLLLEKLEVSPPLVPSGASLKILVELSAIQPISISDLAILVYSSLGLRVAVIDLRKSNAIYRIERLNTETFIVNIKSFCLVEGNYNIGLYLQSNESSGDFLDLSSVTVSDKVTSRDIAPYSSTYRGLVELNYDFNYSTKI